MVNATTKKMIYVDNCKRQLLENKSSNEEQVTTDVNLMPISEIVMWTEKSRNIHMERSG